MARIVGWQSQDLHLQQLQCRYVSPEDVCQVNHLT